MVFNKQRLTKAVESMENDSFDLIALLNSYKHSDGPLKSDEKELEGIDCYEIIKLISLISGHSEVEIKSKRRFKNLAEWRHVTYFLIYTYTSLTYAKVADIFNTKHDNILHGCRRVKDATEGFNNDLLLKLQIAEQVFKVQFNIFNYGE